MASNSGKQEEEPVILFGGEWIPAKDAWKKMETATVVVDHIARFNDDFPDLASRATREVVPLVRQRLRDVELRMPMKAELPDVSGIARSLLESMSLEDTLDTLAEQHNTAIDMAGLMQLVGDQSYIDALRREGQEFAMNRISPDQTAQLWNELSRPAPGGGLWSAKKVAMLLQAS